MEDQKYLGGKPQELCKDVPQSLILVWGMLPVLVINIFIIFFQPAKFTKSLTHKVEVDHHLSKMFYKCKFEIPLLFLSKWFTNGTLKLNHSSFCLFP